MLKPPRGTVCLQKYGIERMEPPVLREGAPIRYRFTNRDGRQFGFENYFLRPETYSEAFAAAGFRDFRWLDVSLDPSERDNPFWDDFLNNPPVIAYTATK